MAAKKKTEKTEAAEKTEATKEQIARVTYGGPFSAVDIPGEDPSVVLARQKPMTLKSKADAERLVKAAASLDGVREDDFIIEA